MIDRSECPAPESVPGKLGGAWVFRGSRVPIETLFLYLGRGVSLDEFLDWFEGVSREQALAVLEFIRGQSRRPAVMPAESVPA